jgi:hypothetical protein
MGPGTRLEDMGKREFLLLPRAELRSLGRPAFSQSPRRLRCTGSLALLKQARFLFWLIAWVRGSQSKLTLDCRLSWVKISRNSSRKQLLHR